MDPQLLVGSIFDEKFHIISIAGAGGMGVVYKARQIALDREVAIKILRPGLVKDNEFKLRFDREAQILSAFSHQHVGMFYSYGEGRLPNVSHSLPYIAMEFMQGSSLQTLLLNSGALPWRRAVKICRQICQAMSAAHKAGVIHRDLKPANVILLSSPEQDFVKVVDFGLATIVADTDEEAIKLTRTGDLVGTPAYFSPEQCQGKPAENRSDIYAVGCILYEMLCGKAPFTGDTPVELIYKHVKEEAVELSKQTRNELPPGIEQIVKKAMSKKPEDRYQSMNDLETDLGLVQNDQAENLRFSHKGETPKSSNAAKIAVIILLISLAAAAFLSYWFYKTDQGMIYHAQLDLGGSPGKEMLLNWLSISRKKGEKNSSFAAKVQNLVADAFKKNNRDFAALSELYLSQAQKSKQSANCDDANYWAKLTILGLPPLTRFTSKSASIFAYRKILNQASTIILSCDGNFDNAEARSIIKMGEFIGDSPAFIDLCCSLGKKNNLPVTTAYMEARLTQTKTLIKRNDINGIKSFVEFCDKDYPFDKSVSKDFRVARSYADVALNISESGNPELNSLAIEIAQEALAHLKLWSAEANGHDYCLIYLNIANTFLNLHENEKASSMSRQLLERFPNSGKIQIDDERAKALISAADSSQKKYAEAIIQAQSAQKILAPSDSDMRLILVTHRLASLVLIESLIKTQRLEEAIRMAEKARNAEEATLHVGKPSDQPEWTNQTMQLDLAIANCFAENGFPEEAAKFLRYALAMKDVHHLFGDLRKTIHNRLEQIEDVSTKHGSS